MNMTATAPVQLGFAHRLQLGARRMLIPLEFVAVTLDLDEDAAVELAESAALWPAWNLATREDGRRRKIHVWRGSLATVGRDSVEPWMAGESHGSTESRPTLCSVIAEVLPAAFNRSPETAYIRGTELAWRFCCSMDLIADLIAEGEIQQVGERSRPKETPIVSWLSVRDFLTRRELGR